MRAPVLQLLILMSGFLTVNAKCYLAPLVPWTPTWQPERNDLLCDSNCEEERNIIPDVQFEYERVDSCCTCYSCTTWEDQEVDLFVEYVTATGKSLVLANSQYNNQSVYKIEHTNSEMTEIPSNLCEWDTDTRLQEDFQFEIENIKPFLERIVILNFNSNKIRQIGNLNCMTRLDKIDLEYNRIQYVSNTSIQYLSYLREINLANNQISRIDPNFLFRPELSVFFADLSYNALVEVDITNALTMHPFCHIDYSFNSIDKIINELNFKLNHSIQYGPGIVSLVDNIFETFPDFEELFNLDSLNELGALFAGGFDFRGIKINCDCNLEPFRSLVGNISDTFWRGYHNVTCYNPPELSGIPVVKVPPEKMVCPLTAESNCPRACTCVDRSKEDTLYVDCSFQGLRALPETLPESKFSSKMSLNLSGNSISTIDNRTYLYKLSFLDLSKNRLDTIDDNIASLLENATLDISNNRLLRTLPSSFQIRHMCVTIMANLTIDCDCSNIWIETWFKSKQCSNKPTFKCQINTGQIMPAETFRGDDLKCSENLTILLVISVTLAGIALLLLLLGLITYKFRYEILIIYLRCRQIKMDCPVTKFTWDIAITFNEDDELLYKWVKEHLSDDLTSHGYRLFLPYRDVPYGGERDSFVNEAFLKTRSVILVLSDTYFQTEEEDVTIDEEPQARDRKWTENEWKYAWNQYRVDKTKNLVIINYDHLSTSCVEQPQIRAFLRVGHTVQFGNHKNEVMNEIIKKVGPAPLKPALKNRWECELAEPEPDYDTEKDVKQLHEYENPQQEMVVLVKAAQPELSYKRERGQRLAGATVQEKIKFYNEEGIILQ